MLELIVLRNHTLEVSMMIIGDDYFGKVDSVPGLFFVKTRFLHCNCFPLVPRESYLFLDAKTDLSGYCGVKIPFGWKSLGIAWSRAVLAIAIAMSLFAGGVVLFVGTVDGTVHRGIYLGASWSIALILILIMRLTYKCEPANLKRAVELGHYLGFASEEVERWFSLSNTEVAVAKSDAPNVMHGSIDAEIEELRKRIDELERMKQQKL
jgi:hypothetical protein